MSHQIDLADNNRSDNRFVILAVGESTTYGLHVGLEQSYPKQLERLLNERFGDTRFIVKNVGFPSQTSTSILRNIDSQMLRYKPDLVISLIGANDCNEALNDLNSRVIFGSTYIPEWIASLRTYKLFSIAKDFILHSPQIKDEGIWLFYDATQRNPDSSWVINNFYLRQLYLNYQDIIGKVRNHNARIVITSYLKTSPAMRQLLERVARDNNVVYADNCIAVDERREDMFIEDQWHPSVIGHKMMAERLFETLLEQNMLPAEQNISSAR